MATTKADLQAEIKEMEAVYNNADTPQNVKDLLKEPLANARKILADMEKKPAAKKPAPVQEKKTKAAVQTAKKVVTKAKKAVKQKPGSAGHEKTLKQLVAGNKKLQEIYAGYSEEELQADAKRKATAPGTRVSATGKEYREYRPNRTDVGSGKDKIFLKEGGFFSFFKRKPRQQEQEVVVVPVVEKREVTDEVVDQVFEDVRAMLKKDFGGTTPERSRLTKKHIRRALEKNRRIDPSRKKYKIRLYDYLEDFFDTDHDEIEDFEQGGTIKTAMKDAEFVASANYPGHFTIGKDDGNKPLYSAEEVALIKKGYTMEYEFRAARRNKTYMEELLADVKEKNKSAVLTHSDNEFGGNWRIFVKAGKSFADGGEMEDDEIEDGDEDMYPEEPNYEEDAFITDVVRGGYDVSAEAGFIAHCETMEEALQEITTWAKENNVWPNLWFISDHGNATLIDYEGEHMAAGGTVDEPYPNFSLVIDDTTRTTLDEFMDENEETMDAAELDKIKLLQPGEQVFIGVHAGYAKIERPKEMANGGYLGDHKYWKIIGLSQPPANITPAGAAAFIRAIDELEKEKPAKEDTNVSVHYENAKAAMNKLATIITELLSLHNTNNNEATRAHALLQEVGIYNYKTGLLLDTSWLNKELDKRILAQGGSIKSPKKVTSKHVKNSGFEKGEAYLYFVNGNMIAIIDSQENGWQLWFTDTSGITEGAKLNKWLKEMKDGDHVNDGCSELFDSFEEAEKSLMEEINLSTFAKGGKIDNNTVEKLAKEFSRLLRRDLKPSEINAIIAENNEPGNEDTDASHDYLDANMTMDEAFINVMGRRYVFFNDDIPETEEQNDKDTDLQNRAWGMAKKHNYYEGHKLTYPRKKQTIKVQVASGSKQNKTFSELGEAIHYAEHAAMKAKQPVTVIADGKKIGSADQHGNFNEQFAKGGALNRNLSRDRKFKSQQPHEQRYKRTTKPKNPVYKMAEGGTVSKLLSDAAAVDPVYKTITEQLLAKKYFGSNPAWLSFNSGGGMEHVIIQRPDQHWLLFSNNETGISLSKKKYKTAEDAYSDFWEDDQAFDTFIMIDTADYSKQREVAAIVSDVIKGNWKNNYAKGGATPRNLSRDRKFKSRQPHEQVYKRKITPKNPAYNTKKLARRILKKK